MSSVSGPHGWAPARIFVFGVSLLAAWAMVAQGTSQAQEIAVDVQAKDPPEPTEKDPNPPPMFEAHVKGAPGGLAAKDFQLKQVDKDPVVQVNATDVSLYKDSNYKMAMVVLVQGTGYWMGNETYYEGDDAPQEGSFTGLGPAMDELAKAGPKGSRATVLTYGDGKATPKLEMGDVSKLNGSVLGTQKDYESVLDFPLLVGLEQALAIFDNHAGYRKILVVIGDGTGEREDIGGDLNARIEELQQRKVETYTIFYESVESGQQTGYQSMARLGYTDHKQASSRENFATFAKSFVEAINAVYYVSFPGCVADAVPLATTCFDHDSQLHELAVVLQGDETDVVEVQTKLWELPKPPEETSLWWLWLLLILLVVVLIVVIIVKISKREPAPPPMPVEMPVFEPPPQPANLKTMMLGIGGTDDGMPIVGWIVPLNGPNQYQTFKLLDGVSRIGSGGNANIIIQDHFMSTEHCEIIASPTGFRLKDGGSTNGTQVNHQPVSEHDLVDNDHLSMGKTNFKFKSIN